ncbi:MAG: insulinase family protein [Bryobacteraceae bacterium]|nr:insulinase family protein [Bryobacteraceae bacterium]
MTKLGLCLTALCLCLPLVAADMKIPIEKYKLKNGLRVILSQDRSAPVAAVYLIYGVGARSEEKGRTGFAHLFEHMMFQGSTNAPKGFHFATVEANGGYLNGSTHADYTDYFEVLPSNKLPVALWLEADRMRGLAITEENLSNQKEAVKEERRLRMDNQPYVAAIVDKWPEVAFRNWSNSHSIIGSFEDLDAATVEDVSKFFKTYYAPNNAVLAIVGDIDPAEVKKLIDSYFSDIEAQPQPKKPDLAEPTPEKERAERFNDPHAAVPAVIVGYRGPVRRSPDYYALSMLDVVLTGGDSSRFQQNLVKGKQSVIEYESNLGWPFGQASDYVEPGMYAMFMVHNPQFTGRQIVDQINEELASIQRDGVPEKELERARTFLRSSHIRRMESAISRATLLGQYEVLDGDAEALNAELDKFLAVTAEQIQAAAKKYCQPNLRAVLEVVPAQNEEEK